MKIFNFDNYKEFILKRIHAMPNHGRGEFQKISKELRIHSTRLSHIFRGSLDLTLEQACSLSRYLGLDDLESEYFLALVQLERAGSEDLRKMIRKQIENIKSRSQQLIHRVQHDKVLNESERAIFYSDWSYSAIRLISSISEYQTVDAIAQYFKLPRERVRKIIDFLLSTGLCKEESGNIKRGPNLTHLEAESLLAHRHHANWRLKAIQQHERLTDRELAYTCPVSVSEKDIATIRQMLISFIEKFIKLVSASEPDQKVACLIIDWFNV